MVDTAKQKVKCFRAGQIANYVHQWKMLTSDPEILDIVQGAHIEFESLPKQSVVPLPNVFSQAETELVASEIRKLIQKGVIQPCIKESNDFISKIFLRPKNDGSHRLILNLKNLNQTVTYHHFKMDNLYSILKLVKQNCWMASVDLKDAYYSCPVAQEHQKYLKFFWNNQYYKFTCFPNGLACCPRKFTKLMKPVFATLRKGGHISASYIDDTYLQGDTKEECQANINATVDLIHSLGLVAHPEKSVFQSTQILSILGFVLNSIEMTVKLTVEKAVRLVDACQMLIQTKTPSIRRVAQVIGYIVASFPGVMFGPLYYRVLEGEKSLALKQCHGDYDAKMTLTEHAKKELQWWVNNTPTAYNVINRCTPNMTIFTDASNIGWGGVIEGQARTGDNWTPTEAKNHINYLELLAILYSLKAFRANLAGKHVKVMCDNTTAVSCITHMGTSHSVCCNKLTTAIWEWCAEYNIWLTAAYIPGAENQSADYESRVVHTGKEWQLNKELLHCALSILNYQPGVDLFASRHNAQCKLYVSYRPDPGCMAVDAFSLNWHSLMFYAFPPFSVLTQTIQKIEKEEATGVLVVPNWPTQVWYPALMRLLIQHPLLISPDKSNLCLPCYLEEIHPLHKTLQLLVCHVSGEASKRLAFQRRLPTLCSKLGAAVHNNNITPTLKTGDYTVIPQGVIHFQLLSL